MKKKKNTKVTTQTVYNGKTLALSGALSADRWAALTVLDPRQEYTLEEAKRLIDEFKNKEVI